MGLPSCYKVQDMYVDFTGLDFPGQTSLWQQQLHFADQTYPNVRNVLEKRIFLFLDN
jgi:hypothetical protein